MFVIIYSHATFNDRNKRTTKGKKCLSRVRYLFLLSLSMFYKLDDRKAAVVYSPRIPFEYFRTFNSVVHSSKSCYEWERESVARTHANDMVGRTREQCMAGKWTS